MSFLAANLAGFPDLSPCVVERAIAGLSTGNGGGELLLSCGGHAYSYPTAIAANFRRLCANQNFVLQRVCRYVSRLVRAPLRGFSCARRQLALLLRLRRPAGYGFPPNLIRKERRKDFSGASVNAELRRLGASPTRFLVPRSRSGNSTNGDSHVPEQSNPHRLPRQQRRSPYQ